MSKIREAFADGKAFIAFITAGDPTIEDTERYIREMVRAGADLIEIGIPFSDPIAEGIVIQEADIRALASGTTVDAIFAMVERLRGELQVPLVLMTYVNPVFHYGYAAFFARSSAVGIDGIIVPDVPFEEKGEIEREASKHGVELISMVAPTSDERIRSIAAEAKGFLYLVSSMGVTGVRGEITTDIGAIVRKVREVSDVPVAVGFGISTPGQAEEMAALADGVIVGSAIVRIVAEHGSAADAALADYVRQMKEAVSRSASRMADASA